MYVALFNFRLFERCVTIFRNRNGVILLYVQVYKSWPFCLFGHNG